MSLQDDIARLLGELMERPGTPVNLNPCHPDVEAFAAGLESDYYLVKLADLPKLRDDGAGNMYAGNRFLGCVGDLEGAQAQLLGYVAVVRHLQSRESEAAALQARRDELVHQYGYELTYAGQSPMVKDLINRLISANADHTVAGEAEVARLKGEGR